MHPFRPPCILALAFIGAAFVGAGASPTASPDAASFATEADAAMRKMMADMEVKASGDVDRDFVAMMIPHHQGAIDMARAQLRYGRNEQLRRLAQEIIVSQSQEIAVMRLAVSTSLDPSTSPPGATSPTTQPAHPHGASR